MARQEDFKQGEFQGQVLARLTAIEKILTENTLANTDLEKRVRILEDRDNQVKGMAVLLGAVSGGVVQIAFFLVSKFLK